ncbi:Stress response protein nst1 [Mortierella antarctica]|nr:Stress response protein nst1 [Mortierella antarctica]
MAAHTFAPEESLPPPKAAVIYSRDGRKRSLNIDMTRHFSPTINDHSMAFSSASSSVAAAGSGRQGASIETAHHTTKDVNPLSTIPAHKKKKKKKTKKKTLERIEESEHGHNGHHSSTTSRQSNGAHGHSHANCRHEDGSHHHHHRHHAHQMPEPRIQPNNPDSRPHPHAQTHPHPEHEDEEDEEDEDFYSDEDPYDPETPAFSSSHDGEAHGGSSLSKKKKKKRKKTTPTTATTTVATATTRGATSSSVSSGHASSKALVHPTSGYRHDHVALAKHMHDNHPQNDGFWHYSDAEERQRIREFWFQLREEERRSLVRVEKEAVLKKMKEQQRHSCSCSLCGRKRTAIEEELELLYDAYYDELEQYANQQQPTDGHALPYSQHSQVFDDEEYSDDSRDEEDEEDDEEDDDDDEDDEEEEDEEGYEDDDEEDEEYEDEISSRKAPAPYRNGFPNTLQAKGNILTVAEDLLENDGKKFLEMMDRLADRKVQRDDELMDQRGVYDEYEDEEEGDFEDDGADEDVLTKEQRMEEGRRMFQAFAARMFEQRVLSAYREKVAQERQERLLAELEEESRQEQLREERKEREKEKKRDKKRMQRQQKEEERAAKEAQRLAEEKRLLEERERKLEADRKRREEEKRVKDEEKRLREEERLKKEEEKKRKLKEDKAREAEKERKRKEQLAKEKEAEEKKAEEAAQLEAKKLERQAYLQQQLLDEQKRQQELRRQEQLAKEALAKAEEEEEEQGQSNDEDEQEASPSPSSIPFEAQQPEQSGSPPTTPPTVDPTPIQSLSGSGNSVPSGWSSFQSHDVQLHPQLHLAQHTPHLQHQLRHPPQQPQHAFQGMYRPSNHFGQIGDDLFARSGRPFMGTIGHQGQQHFPNHQHPLSNQMQQVSGLSPGLAPIGYGQPVPSKQLLNIMGNVPSTHYDTSSAASPLNSPSSLGAIGTPVGGSFGPISPIGHSRRTSTPHGSTTSESIKPIQRPIGRPKDPATSMSSSGASSFDGLSLGLSGLAIGSELEKRSRSPPLNLSGSLDLDGVVLGADLGRSTESGSKSPTLRGQRESSLFSNSFFGAGGVRSSQGESLL